MIRLAVLMWLALGGVAFAETMRLAVTTSFHNSGLSDVLLPVIKAEIGLEVQLLVVGTGQALRLGRAGDVDAILVHSKAAEDAFVAEGFAPYRREIMYNDFVLIGPAHDPAQLAQATSASDALKRIAAAKAPFISRGDESGTHKKELVLWDAAALEVSAFDPWYKAVGAGMDASLNTASAMGAYILADRASWLNFCNKTGLALLYAGDPALFNQYAYLPVNAVKHPHVNAAAAQALEAWLVSQNAADLINGYSINGERLFSFNAQN
jgi:tungstate transport system substrate-binding protein